ncbi:MAG: ABC transporter permease [bacterium]|nr:ABC transporter permease [bacterium]
MFDLDNWQEIYHALASNKLRTFLTAFGVFWGIFLLMVMLGSGSGLENGVVAGFEDEATNSFFVWTRRTSIPYRGLPSGRRFELTGGDTEAIRLHVPEAAVVAPRNQLGGFRGGNNVTRGNKAGGFSVMGDIPEYIQIESVPIVGGRFLNQLDLDEKRKIAVIGTRVRDVLFEESEDPIGDSIEINGVYFKVVGVFEPSDSGEGGGNEAETIFVPFTTFQNAFNHGDQVDWFAITAVPGVAASVVQEKVLTLLAARHRVAPEDDRAFGHFNMEEEYNQIQGLFGGISMLIWIVGTGTLAAGAIGVSNIMMIIVKERTKEIGVRRAVGARPSVVMRQIVFEAILLTSAAGYVGLLAGVGVMEGVRKLLASAGGNVQMFKNPGVDLEHAVLALVVLVISGTLAGLVPAQRAVSVSPVDALRAE